MTGHLFRIGEAAALVGVSDDTLRRWADAGRVPVTRDAQGRRVVRGTDLAALAQELADQAAVAGSSARNRMRGIVTRVLRDTVMAQVDVQAGPFRVVSLMTREAADELGLEPGVPVVTSVKASAVVVELPR